MRKFNRTFICFLVATLALASSPSTFALICGDSIADAAEQCDDGNIESGDGCSATCMVEPNLGLGQLSCAVDTVDNSAGGLFQPGDKFVVNYPIPRQSDFLGSQSTPDGITGLFGQLMANSFTYTSQNGGQAVGETTQSLLGLQDGTLDVMAVGGFDSNAAFGDWAVTSFSAELADSTGNALNTVETWPAPGFDFTAFDLSQCGVDFQNTETLETARATGTVSQVQHPLPKRPHFLVQRGDWDGLVQTIHMTSALPPNSPIPIVEFYGAANTFVVTDSMPYTGGALHIVRSVELRGAAEFLRDAPEFEFSFAVIEAGAHLILNNNSDAEARISNFASDFIFRGGAIQVHPDSTFSATNYRFSGNSGERGSAIQGNDSVIVLTGCVFDNNIGNALFFQNSTVFVDNSVVSLNTAEIQGCDVLLENDPLTSVNVQFSGSVFGTSNCQGSRVSGNSPTAALLKFTHVEGSSGGDSRFVDGGSEDDLLKFNGFESIFLDEQSGSNQSSAYHLEGSSRPAMKPEAFCAPGSPDSVVSLGYNISSDDSCNLDQSTDLTNTDPLMSAPDELGIRSPLPGSPAIDFGPSELVKFDGDDGPSLPCGWRDILGLGRPQDGNGDGVFECDAGAVEVQGAGEIVPGHSGAFYNSLRNGEGEYVEILNDTTAVIYTFTFNPDGSGPAWFVSLADVVGNSLVSRTLNRPVGAGFGEAFDPDDVDFTNIGGMSMVFPACETAPVAGNIAFSGDEALGYHPLITRAERITHIAGCGMKTTPHANAGLSGSFFDADRNGEGLIVQWLPDGTVLAIMFTFAPNGEQMWITGTGMASGNSVTIEAVYPTGFTSWGSGFDAEEVQLSPWGKFTLTWTSCSSLTFEYDSDLPAYGSATRNYSRLTSLAGLGCP